MVTMGAGIVLSGSVFGDEKCLKTAVSLSEAKVYRNANATGAAYARRAWGAWLATPRRVGVLSGEICR
jgi:hypothetical protein